MHGIPLGLLLLLPLTPIQTFDMNNTIMAAYQDINPAIAGSITWDTFGVAPCRTMVINWTSVPMFSCTGLIDSQQIVLHEFSNVIDVNIANKPICATWNDGLALQGIQNSTGTAAVVAPGRNNTVWSANNDSRRFTPSGNPYQFNTTYTWRDGTTNAFLGTGSTLSISTPFPTSVVCEAAIFGGCTNDTTFARDTTFFLPGKVQADFDMDVRLGCDNDTVVFTNNTNPFTPTTYFWNFGDANFSSATDPTHVYGVQNLYNVTLVASHPICEGDTVQKSVNLNHPIDADFETQPDSVCLGTAFIISNNSSATAPVPASNLFINSWDMGDGNVFVNNNAQFPYTYQQPGTYTIKLVITDTLGCQDSISKIVFVEDSSFVSMTASPTEVCLGDVVQFLDQKAAHTVSTTYDFDDGNILANKTNPRHTYQNPGTYNVVYTGFYLICPPESDTVTINVNDRPLVNLGPDTSICPGVTESITLSDINNPAQIMEWSDGSTGPSLLADTFGYYWARATNGFCETTDSIWVKRDCYLNIPNTFSPNGDGSNDYFIPRQLLSSGLKEFSMKIMNRWGEVIFQTNSIDGRGWDGKYDGKDQPVGVYVYLIDAQWDNNYRNSFTGNVTLLR